MTIRRVVVVVAAVVAVLAAVLGIAYWRGWFARPSVSGAPAVTLPDSAVKTLVSGLVAPWGLAFLPDGSALVTERDSARILSVTADGTVREVQRIDEARPSGEGGLLGIAVSPSYASDRWVYVYYTAASDNRIARLRLGERPQPILTGIPRAGNHNGGRLAFGPDGMLYAGTGDAAQRGRAQDRANLGGKILRMTPEGAPAAGNPFGGSVVWSMGHRNVQGLAWDAQGRMYASEFGQNRYDELNRIEPGRNYGWPEVEGPGSGGGRYVEPIATWATDDASPSGIAIAGERVYMACLRGQRLYRIGLDGKAPEVLLAGKYGRLRHVALAPDGSLWVLTSNRDGRGSPSRDDDRILRLTP
jgi:glucose/arabinose dehydrogenase